MRDYISTTETSKLIINDVIEFGSSKNWPTVNSNNITIAKDIERQLAKFNIGYVDPKTGTWAIKKDGTRYFTTITMLNVARNKVGSLLSSFKK